MEANIFLVPGECCDLLFNLIVFIYLDKKNLIIRNTSHHFSLRRKLALRVDR